MISSLLVVLSFQAPAQATVPQDPTPAAALDVVELKNGDRLEGRITTQLDGYLELQLGEGATIGLSMAQIAAVHRSAGAPVAAVVAALQPRDEWFVLHDGRGEAVGWMHASVTTGPDGTARVAEEYEFVQGQSRYQVTQLCTADASLQPRACYFRERRREPLAGIAGLLPADPRGQLERVEDERIVEADCRGDHLQVVRLDRKGRHERNLPFARGTTYPLLARAVARQSGAAVVAAPMFDPATEELVVRHFDAARLRKVVLDGRPQQVTEIAESSSTGRNSEWLDASMRTVRRELAGPALVAVPSSADSARSTVGSGRIASAIVAEPEGRFGLWRPNPAWQPVEVAHAGQIALVCAAHDASIGLARIDHLDRDTPLQTAADAVANWFRLLHPELRIEGREPSSVRDRAAVRMTARGRTATAAVQATVDVIPHGAEFLVLVCRAPAAAWAELEADFAFVLRSIELEPQGFAPPLQGPIAERERRAARAQRRAPELPPLPQPELARQQSGDATAPAKRTLVRVPRDG